MTGSQGSQWFPAGSGTTGVAGSQGGPLGPPGTTPPQEPKNHTPCQCPGTTRLHPDAQLSTTIWDTPVTRETALTHITRGGKAYATTRTGRTFQLTAQTINHRHPRVTYWIDHTCGQQPPPPAPTARRTTTTYERPPY